MLILSNQFKFLLIYDLPTFLGKMGIRINCNLEFLFLIAILCETHLIFYRCCNFNARNRL